MYAPSFGATIVPVNRSPNGWLEFFTIGSLSVTPSDVPLVLGFIFASVSCWALWGLSS